MTIFKSLYCPFLAPTKVSLTLPLAEKEKTEVTKLTHFTSLGQRIFTKARTTLEKCTTGPSLHSWTEKWNTGVIFPLCRILFPPLACHGKMTGKITEQPCFLAYRMIFNFVKIKDDITSSLSGFRLNTATQ